MLENKFKVSGLKPNIATGKWYANESIISCNVSEWVSQMKYVFNLILGYNLRIRRRDDGNIRLSKNNRGIFLANLMKFFIKESLTANTDIIYGQCLASLHVSMFNWQSAALSNVPHSESCSKIKKVHIQQNLSSYSSHQWITDGSNVQCNISSRVSSI